MQKLLYIGCICLSIEIYDAMPVEVVKRVGGSREKQINFFAGVEFQLL